MKKNRRVIIRITEDQFRMLSEHIIKEEQTKSEYLRGLLVKELNEISKNTSYS
jgi:hypothetical protein